MTDPIDPARRAAAIRALKLSDEALLKECEENFFIASGPGGQHRNKTESGVRLTHLPTGITVSATERRSQLQNRGEVVVRMRAALEPLSFIPKKRRPTKPSKGSQRRRLDSKKRNSQKKADRRGGD